MAEKEQGKPETFTRSQTLAFGGFLTVFNVMIGILAQWIFFPKAEGLVLVEQVRNLTQQVQNVTNNVSVLSGTINGVLVQQAKQGELGVALAGAIQELKAKHERADGNK